MSLQVFYGDCYHFVEQLLMAAEFAWNPPWEICQMRETFTKETYGAAFTTCYKTRRLD